MTIGLCTGDRAEIRAAREAGFDHVELPRAMAVAEATRIAEEGWPVEAVNLFLGPDDVVAKGFSDDWWEAMDGTLETLAEVGVATVVVGSGGQRRGSGERFVEFAARLAFAATKFGLTVAPENLRPEESDVGTDVRAFADALAARRVGFTVDSYHVRQATPVRAWDDALTRRPAHVHVARGSDRATPDDDADTRAFFARLRDLGYDGRVSYEGSRDRPLPEIAARLRALAA